MRRFLRQAYGTGLSLAYIVTGDAPAILARREWAGR